MVWTNGHLEKYLKGSNLDKIQSAMELAREKHSHQTYRGGVGSYYYKHILQVLRVVKEYTTKPEVLIAAVLHDIVEDSDVSLEEVENLYGKQVRDLVWRLTDESGLNRKERKLKTYPKIRGDKFAVLIKLADRYINMKGSEKLKMYQYEYPDFRNALYVHGQWDALWDALDKLAGYDHGSTTKVA